MSGGTSGTEPRNCVRCSAVLPEGRSVCPACGTLQPRRDMATGPIVPRTIGPAPVAPPAAAEPDAAEAPATAEATATLPTTPAATADEHAAVPTSAGLPRYPGADEPAPSGGPSYAGAPAASPSVAAPMAPDPRRAATPGGRRRSPATIIAGIVVLVALISGAAYAWTVWSDDEDGSTRTALGNTGSGDPTADKDPRSPAIRAFCADPTALDTSPEVAAFEPGKGAVAYVEMPRIASATTPPQTRVVQVSPEVGEPKLRLDESVSFVSLAICFEQTGSRDSGGTCRYELTNPSELGEKEKAPLLETTYRGRIIELRTGTVVAKGNLKTATDRCPEDALIGGKGVANEVTDAELTAWIGSLLVNGVPS